MNKKIISDHAAYNLNELLSYFIFEIDDYFENFGLTLLIQFQKNIDYIQYHKLGKLESWKVAKLESIGIL